MSAKITTTAILVTFALAGCSHDTIKPPATAHAASPRPVKAEAKAPEKTDDGSAHALQNVTNLLGLDAEIVRLCNLHFDVAPTEEGAPRFDTDEDNLTPQDTAVLSQVARCLTNGPLTGRHVQLVGRADSRGTTEYNFILGAHRASTVSHFLEAQGVQEPRINETSRGELDAQGNDDTSMRDDRRVDILLGS